MLELSKKLDLNTKLQNRNFRLDLDKVTYRQKLCEKILPNIKIVFFLKSQQYGCNLYMLD